ncbi:MAG: hypothetical protein KGJ41_17435 [Rhodospirillales bacterium]|nr:hypothetical protein [Rhodospirillales bacterium]
MTTNLGEAFLGALAAVLIVSLLGVCRRAGARLSSAFRTAKPAPIPSTDNDVADRIARASHDLRLVAMNLDGHVTDIASGRLPKEPIVAEATSEVLAISDELQGFASRARSRVSLKLEPVDLHVALEAALRDPELRLAAQRREWRIAPEVRMTTLSADRRALRHVLTRALLVADRNADDRDWIGVDVQHHAESLALVIADGKATPLRRETDEPQDDAAKRPPQRLVLSDVLMQAHGGQLRVNTSIGAGVQIMLLFPSQCVVMP